MTPRGWLQHWPPPSTAAGVTPRGLAEITPSASLCYVLARGWDSSVPLGLSFSLARSLYSAIVCSQWSVPLHAPVLPSSCRSNTFVIHPLFSSLWTALSATEHWRSLNWPRVASMNRIGLDQCVYHSSGNPAVRYYNSSDLHRHIWNNCEAVWAGVLLRL